MTLAYHRDDQNDMIDSSWGSISFYFRVFSFYTTDGVRDRQMVVTYALVFMDLVL